QRSPRDPPGRKMRTPLRVRWDAQGRGYTRAFAPVTRALLAGRHHRGVGALADLVLGRVPARCDDLAEIRLQERGRLEDDRLQRVVARRLEVRGGVAGGRSDRGIDADRDLAVVLVLAQREGGLAGGLAELVAVLPDIDVLLAERQVVQVGRIAVTPLYSRH